VSVSSLSRGFTANTAERIEVLLGVETFGDPRHIVLDGSPDFSHGFDAAFAKLLWPLVSMQQGERGEDGMLYTPTID